MRYFLLNVVLVVFSFSLFAQDLNRSIEPCNCEITFKDLVEKLESNYIALAQKRLANEDKVYEERKISFTKKSAEINAENCTAFLDNFLSYFEDGHLSAFEYPNYTDVELAEFKNEIKNNKLSRTVLDRMVQQGTRSIHSTADRIMGNWTDGQSDFVVIKDNNVYKAYILESTVEGKEFGELKAIFSPTSESYDVDYYSNNYSKRYISGGVYKEGTFFRASNIFWRRKESSSNSKYESVNSANFKLPSIVKIDQNNTILSLPSFSLDFTLFNDFVNENKDLIINSENLIIDIRGNRGGNGVYFSLIKLYATQNMPEDNPGLVLASSDNLAYFERQQQYSKKVFKPVVQRIEANLGEIVDGPLYPEKRFNISKKSKIKNVAILTDEACASAAESFILHSKLSSTKVKTFGSPTDGMIDYTSVNSVLLNSGKQYIYFGYPTGTLHKEIPKNGYNKTGIIPDIPIQDDVTDKVDFIIKYYND